MRGDILAPAAVLVIWTLVMLVWLAAVRVPAIGGAKGLENARRGARGAPANRDQPRA